MECIRFGNSLNFIGGALGLHWGMRCAICFGMHHVMCWVCVGGGGRKNLEGSLQPIEGSITTVCGLKSYWG